MSLESNIVLKDRCVQFKQTIGLEVAPREVVVSFVQLKRVVARILELEAEQEIQAARKGNGPNLLLES